MTSTARSSDRPAAPDGAPFLYTIGHSTRSFEEFASLLAAFAIEQVADVRTVPRSRHNPEFEQPALNAALHQRGFAYIHLKGLGGLRHARADSTNQGWRNPSFRGFADYMQTEVFAFALAELIALAGEWRTAIMCAEAVPWRCHRYLIADALVVRGYEVEHIMAEGKGRRHTLNPLAVVRDGRVTYPAPSGGSPA